MSNGDSKFAGLICRSAALAVAGAISASAWAQSPAWPTKPVRIVVPWPAGGGTDFAARVLAQRMGERTGQTFIVDNRAGAAGNIGAEVVARSPSARRSARRSCPTCRR
jgi:tripartite-type tricarboxylate transporter receptor subunit TctC